MGETGQKYHSNELLPNDFRASAVDGMHSAVAESGLFLHLSFFRWFLKKRSLKSLSGIDGSSWKLKRAERPILTQICLYPVDPGINSWMVVVLSWSLFHYHNESAIGENRHYTNPSLDGTTIAGDEL